MRHEQTDQNLWSSYLVHESIGCYSPYHLESSSSTGETAAALDLGGGGAFFLEKRATILKVDGLEGGRTDLATLVDLSVLPNISDTPKEAAAVDAAREAISGCVSVVGSDCKSFVCLWRMNILVWRCDFIKGLVVEDVTPGIFVHMCRNPTLGSNRMVSWPGRWWNRVAFHWKFWLVPCGLVEFWTFSRYFVIFLPTTVNHKN